MGNGMPNHSTIPPKDGVDKSGRVERAKTILFYDPLIDLAKLAQDLGYDNLSLLARDFKLATGGRLSEYRDTVKLDLIKEALARRRAESPEAYI